MFVRQLGTRTASVRSQRVFAAAAAALVMGGLAGCETPEASAGPGVSQDAVLQQALDGLVRTDGFPASLASLTNREGRTFNQTAGVSDLTTKKQVPVDGQVRIASNTKTFTTVVVLQLVGEGKIDLDAPIETYLPGLVRGDGIDGRHITVRQLLQHTSGLPDYLDELGDVSVSQHTYFQPRTLVDVAMALKSRFAPGTSWEYSNTNYVLAGLLIEKVTGRPLAEQITDRVIHRIGLRHTYYPGVGDQRIAENHPQGYNAGTPGAPLADVTELDPSGGWATGQLIGTPSDLAHFYSALLHGELVEPAQLAQMRTTVDASSGLWPGARYGLGLIGTPLSCGGTAWGHGGDIYGYETRAAATEDGRAVAVAVTALPTTNEAAAHVVAVVDTALCH